MFQSFTVTFEAFTAITEPALTTNGVFHLISLQTPVAAMYWSIEWANFNPTNCLSKFAPSKIMEPGAIPSLT